MTKQPTLIHCLLDARHHYKHFRCEQFRPFHNPVRSVPLLSHFEDEKIEAQKNESLAVSFRHLKPHEKSCISNIIGMPQIMEQGKGGPAHIQPILAPSQHLLSTYCVLGIPLVSWYTTMNRKTIPPASTVRTGIHAHLKPEGFLTVYLPLCCPPFRR